MSIGSARRSHRTQRSRAGDNPPMARFRSDPDPTFWRVNRSIDFDWRLAPDDVDQSRAHAKALRDIGVLTEAELETLDGGLEDIGSELEAGDFEFEDSDEDIHM